MRVAVASSVVLLLLLALGLGVYSRFFSTTALPPEVEDVPRVSELPTPEEFDAIVRRISPSHPAAAIEMFDACRGRYQRDVKNGIVVTLVKKERVKGLPTPAEVPNDKLPEEQIRVSVRGDIPDPTTGKPCVEVLMAWEKGEKRVMGSVIKGSLYSERPGREGTDGKVVVWRPGAPFLKTTPVPVAGSDAKGQSRYSIRDAGVYRGMLRTGTAWKQRLEAGTLKANFIGKEPVEKVGGRVCYVVERTCASPEADAFQLGDPPVDDAGAILKEGFHRVRVMIDAETWMQVGTEIYREDDTLVAAYYFKDLNTNPKFEADEFTEAGLKRLK